VDANTVGKYPMNRFVHVDIAADDPARAVEFYCSVFGWSAQELPGPEPYWQGLARRLAWLGILAPQPADIRIVRRRHKGA